MFLFGNAFGLNTSGLGPVFIVISAFLAIVTTILIFVFIVPEKRKDRLNKFGKFLHKTFNFKYLIVEYFIDRLCDHLRFSQPLQFSVGKIL